MIYGIKRAIKTKCLLTAVASCFMLQSALAFEGRITAALTRGGQATPLLYTAATNCLRVEVTASDRPNPVDLLDLPSGEMTLLFPNNRSLVHLNGNGGTHAPTRVPADASSAGVGREVHSTAPGAGALPMPPMPAMPMMPPPMMEKMELTATGDKTNLLGLACEKFQIKQRGETMEIWATARLFPFQPYVQNQPHRFGPQMIEEKWGGLLAEKKLFPLLAILKFDNGAERYRFEVQSITPEKITSGDAAKLFQPPPDYQELRPLPY
jgi:Domain of unknown function (DUF4412)